MHLCLTLHLDDGTTVDAELPGLLGSSEGELVSALDGFLADRGLKPTEGSWYTADGTTLHPESQVDGGPVAVTAGDDLWLCAADPGPKPKTSMGAMHELTVIDGPERVAPRVFGPGFHCIGGSADDNMPLPGGGLPARAVVLCIRRDGALEVRWGTAPEAGGADFPFAAPNLGVEQFSAHAVRIGVELTVGPYRLSVRPWIAPPSRSAAGGVVINRTPHRPIEVGRTVLEPMPAPPPSPSRSRMAITSFLVPVGSGVGMAVLMGRPQFLLIALLAPVAMAAVNVFERRRGKRSFAEESVAYDSEIEHRSAEVRAAVADERIRRRQALPSLGELRDLAERRESRLWARGAADHDFLHLRLGTAAFEPAVEIAVERGGDDRLVDRARRALEEAGQPDGTAPVLLDLESDQVLGLHGPAADGVARSVVGQIVTRHGPEEVVIAGLLGPAALGGYEWLRWLPHVRSSASPIAGPHLAAWPDDCEALIAALIDVATRRTAVGSGDSGVGDTRVVVLVHEAAGVDRSMLARLGDIAPASGVRMIWVGSEPAFLPRHCRVVAAVAEGPLASRCTSTDPRRPPVQFTAEPACTDELATLARLLSPLRDAASVAQAGSLPSVADLDELTPGERGIEAVQRRWNDSDGSTLSAPIGAGADELFGVDLVSDGPHALIAGTSGSGKSELIQTMVASLALHHPPERLTFLFVDYKGGAAAAPFANLPHTVGSVTNLDPRMARRALISLRAELDRRMTVLADANPSGSMAKNLTELSAVDPRSCPPRLVIVIDEFATLAKEIPEFVEGVVDVAQRGRSLGIHLVLATQRPAGVVNENIRANTNLRIALRVVDEADSRNVIGVTDAAQIPLHRRGRAFARVGPAVVTPLQVAWSGAPAGSGSEEAVARDWGFSGGASPAPHVGSAATQLESAVELVVRAHHRWGGGQPRRPWMPPLPEHILLSELAELPGLGDGPARSGARSETADPGRVLVYGALDDPAHQRRRQARLDLASDGGLAIFGVGGSGRTTALRTLVGSAVSQASPRHVQVAAFDFSGRGLLSLLDLPHTRAVVTNDDLEAVAREIEQLGAEIVRRRRLLAEARVESLVSLRASGADVARILVVIDGFGQLRGELDNPQGHEWMVRLNRVLVDGRSIGIHPLITADRRSDIPNSVLGAMSGHLVLRMSDADAMVALGVPHQLARGNHLPPGRGYHGDREIQVAIADAGLPVIQDGPPAPRAPGFAESVTRPAEADHGWTVGLGVDDLGRAVTVDVLGGDVLVLGPPGSGRSSALAAIAEGLALLPRHISISVVGPPQSPLIRADGPYPWLRSGRITVLSDIDEATDALSGMGAGAAPATSDPEHSIGRVVVVDDADCFEGTRLAATLEALAAQRGTRLVVGAESAVTGRAYTGWAPVVRRGRRIVVLQPDGPGDLEQLAGVRVRFRPGAQFPTGRGFLVQDRRPTGLQVGRNA